jgi:hypothetical protein
MFFQSALNEYKPQALPLQAHNYIRAETVQIGGCDATFSAGCLELKIQFLLHDCGVNAIHI